MKAINFLILGILASCGSFEEKRKDPNLQEMHQLRQCYLESDTYGKKKSANLKMSILIDQNGDVEDTKLVSSDVKDDPNFESCMLIYVKMQKFVPQDNGTSYERTEEFNFHTRIP